MCLTSNHKKLKGKIIKEGKRRGYIRVYKVCQEYLGYEKYTGSVMETAYRAGLRQTHLPGWHVYLSRRAAKYREGWIGYGGEIKVCYAKPSWLLKVGYDNGSYTRAATFKALVFPKWNKGNMTIREFREKCKGRKIR